MVQRQNLNQLVREVLGDIRIAIGDMGYKVYEIAE
jgi:hypothetical protein